jgi:hypothetical protein
MQITFCCPFIVIEQHAIEDKALPNSFLENKVGKTVEYHMTPKGGPVTKKELMWISIFFLKIVNQS